MRPQGNPRWDLEATRYDGFFLAFPTPVLEIGPPTKDFGSIWSSKKTRKFCHVNFPF